jgi:hypothetical protein
MAKLAHFLPFLCLVVLPAHAVDLAGGERVQITGIAPEDCARMATLEPNGEADYKPGVAADGTSVLPADVEGSISIAPPDLLAFKVRVAPIANPADRFNRSYIDTIEIEIDPRSGRVTVEGQEIDGAAHEIADACRQSQPN